ncbi:MAG: pqq-dependent dehydrogenase, methanol/ethanol family [Gemmatimonadetes bacterium]|nr:pqq-dependent dehydrogenase, methanol/ethanol family [Gemmatimonadota bacterium]
MDDPRRTAADLGTDHCRRPERETVAHPTNQPVNNQAAPSIDGGGPRPSRGAASKLLRAGVLAAALLAACGRPARERASGDTKPPSPSGLVASNGRAVATDGQWVRPTGDYAGTRFSGLDQINASNVRGLRLAWTFSTGVLRGQEAAPLYVDGTIYVVTPFPNLLYAIGLDGTLKWTYRPQPMTAAQGVACCDVVNRGVVYDAGRLFYNTLDAQTVAVDAATGREVWRARVGDINIGETVTMAPLVVRGKVIVGNSGGEMGVRGWLTALDEATGKVAWRAYATGPDADVLIGPGFHPFYPQDRGRDLGVKTWPGDAWKIGGGTAWGFLTYDPELNLLFAGVANPGPWNAEARPGDNKWTAGVFARNPDDGQAAWYYQYNPHDLWDYDGINENVVVDLTLGGRARKTLLHPDRNGYLYVMDRTSGEVISATPFVHLNSTLGVDLRTGRPTENQALHPSTGKVVRGICPAAPGAKDWQPSSWSPRTQLLYIPHQNLCMDYEGVEANYIAGTPYVGANVKMFAGPGGYRGLFTAWDPVKRRPAWQLTERFPVWSGALATAGDVVFYGTMDGFFKAVDARTGRLLWQFKTGSGIISQPTTFRGPDGRQYVAVLDGVGGWSGAIVAAGLDARDSSSALGMINAMKDLPQYTTKGGSLYVFALP